MAIAVPKIVGIVNLTADSFSDGGRYLDFESGIAHARGLVAAGADVIELGAVASNPEAKAVSVGEERRRLEPVLAALAADEVEVSVDSFATPTQAYCLERGVSLLNDINGFADPAFYPQLAAADCRLVVMHSLRGAGKVTRETSEANAVLDAIFDFFTTRLAALEAAGVDPQRIIIDPGMGLFLGATVAPSVQVLRNLGSLKSHFDKALMVSVSRKSFLGSITGRGVDERGAATLAAELYAAMQGADYLRTHDVAALADALVVTRVLEADG